MFLLDTNVVSELRKARSGKTDSGVVRWAASVDSQLLFLFVITLLELEIGVLQIERLDPLQGLALTKWMEGAVKTAFAGRILPVDAAVASQCARLQVPDRKPEADALIAATAIVRGFTVVTRNVGDFRSIPVSLLNPWSAT
jgi:predicted nucleic acid-binding protein